MRDQIYRAGPSRLSKRPRSTEGGDALSHLVKQLTAQFPPSPPSPLPSTLPNRDDWYAIVVDAYTNAVTAWFQDNKEPWNELITVEGDCTKMSDPWFSAMDTIEAQVDWFARGANAWVTSSDARTQVFEEITAMARRQREKESEEVSEEVSVFKAEEKHFKAFMEDLQTHYKPANIKSPTPNDVKVPSDVKARWAQALTTYTYGEGEYERIEDFLSLKYQLMLMTDVTDSSKSKIPKKVNPLEDMTVPTALTIYDLHQAIHFAPRTSQPMILYHYPDHGDHEGVPDRTFFKRGTTSMAWCSSVLYDEKSREFYNNRFSVSRPWMLVYLPAGQPAVVFQESGKLDVQGADKDYECEVLLPAGMCFFYTGQFTKFNIDVRVYVGVHALPQMFSPDSGRRAAQ